MGDELIGECLEIGKLVYFKSGCFGFYVQFGMIDDEEKFKNVFLLKGMELEDVNFEVVFKFFLLLRIVGIYFDNEELIVVYNGCYGFYIKCGVEMRLFLEDVLFIEVLFEQLFFLFL